jgi:uncharacterized protein (DUF2249 family)
MAFDSFLAIAPVPEELDPVEIDVRDLPPPEPQQKTLETLESMADDTVLVQVNDREPQHLFPMLEERGYAAYSGGTEPTLTAIWDED